MTRFFFYSFASILLPIRFYQAHTIRLANSHSISKCTKSNWEIENAQIWVLSFFFLLADESADFKQQQWMERAVVHLVQSHRAEDGRMLITLFPMKVSHSTFEYVWQIEFLAFFCRCFCFPFNYFKQLMFSLFVCFFFSISVALRLKHLWKYWTLHCDHL